MEYTSDSLLALSRAFMQSRILISGAELDLFTLLAPAALTAREIVEHRGGHLRPLTVLLDALSALGLLHKHEHRYQTPPELVPLLTADASNSVLPMIKHAGNMWRTWSQLTEIVAHTGTPAQRSPTAQDEEALRAFIGAMHVMGLKLADDIVQAIDASQARALLDIGGGPGTYTMAFLRANPQLQATLFDRAPVVEMAQERIKSAGLSDRVTFVAGDFQQDPLPPGCDLALLSAIIHMNSAEQNRELYRQIHTALLPGGRLIIRDHVMKPDRIHPVAGSIFAINMLVATTGGGSYTLEEIRADLQAAGFNRIRLLQDGERMDALVEAFKEP